MHNAMHYAHRSENGRPGGNFESRFYQPSPAQLAKAQAAAEAIELTPEAEAALERIDAAIAASEALRLERLAVASAKWPQLYT